MSDPGTRTVTLARAVRDVSLGRAAHPGGLSPLRLPHARDQTARYIADPGGAVMRTFPQHHAAFDRVVRHLEASELYWVTPDMSALAVAAGDRLDTVRWMSIDRPSGCGLIVFAGGIGMTGAGREPVPVDALSWGPVPGGVAITQFVGRWRIDTATVDPAPLPPLILAQEDNVEGHGGEVPISKLPPHSRAVIVTLAAAWSLMDQPTIASRTEVPMNRKLVRSYHRAGRPTPSVSIIDLRTIYRPTAEEAADSQNRTYRHRWVVRGHWRDQAHGRGRELRKRIYVPSYIKGPDGAPLLATEHVNVWRR